MDVAASRIHYIPLAIRNVTRGASIRLGPLRWRCHWRINRDPVAGLTKQHDITGNTHRPQGVGVSCLATVHYIRRHCHDSHHHHHHFIIHSSFLYDLSSWLLFRERGPFCFGWGGGVLASYLQGSLLGFRISRFKFQVMALYTFLPYWPTNWSCVYHALFVQQEKKIGPAWHGMGQRGWASKAGLGLDTRLYTFRFLPHVFHTFLAA